jgi:hypothetical protein
MSREQRKAMLKRDGAPGSEASINAVGSIAGMPGAADSVAIHGVTHGVSKSVRSIEVRIKFVGLRFRSFTTI